MSEGRLRARVAAWEREQHFAPRYVADQLEAAHAELRQARTDATVWEARADAETDPLEADQLRVAAAQAARRAEELAPIVADLTFADDARTAWRYDTAVCRDLAERARHGAGLRGINLDNPAERVTAEEWLDADLAEKLAADADRVITEDDFAPTDDEADRRSPDRLDYQDRRAETVGPDDHGRELVDDADGFDVDGTWEERPDPDALSDERRRPAEVPIETAPSDIRETSVPDLSERDDPQQRRRVPLRDETAATVDRAQLAVAEMAARRDAEAAEAARAAEVDPDEDDRRDELSRWAEQDQPDVTDTGRAADVDDEPQLER